jgi:phosphatidylcholine synthase
VVLALLTFVPTRYLYPSQHGRLNMVANCLGGVWTLLLLWVLYEMPDGPWVRSGTLLSLFFPIFYMVASFLITVRLWNKPRQDESLGSLQP